MIKEGGKYVVCLRVTIEAPCFHFGFCLHSLLRKMLVEKSLAM